MRNLMRAIRRIAQLAFFLSAVSWLSASAQSHNNLDYVLAPLRTEFHRSEISSKASAILILNANAIEANRDGDL